MILSLPLLPLINLCGGFGGLHMLLGLFGIYPPSSDKSVLASRKNCLWVLRQR